MAKLKNKLKANGLLGNLDRIAKNNNANMQGRAMMQQPYNNMGSFASPMASVASAFLNTSSNLNGQNRNDMGQNLDIDITRDRDRTKNRNNRVDDLDYESKDKTTKQKQSDKDTDIKRNNAKSINSNIDNKPKIDGKSKGFFGKFGKVGALFEGLLNITDSNKSNSEKIKELGQDVLSMATDVGKQGVKQGAIRQLGAQALRTAVGAVTGVSAGAVVGMAGAGGMIYAIGEGKHLREHGVTKEELAKFNDPNTPLEEKAIIGDKMEFHKQRMGEIKDIGDVNSARYSSLDDTQKTQFKDWLDSMNNKAHILNTQDEALMDYANWQGQMNQTVNIATDSNIQEKMKAFKENTPSLQNRHESNADNFLKFSYAENYEQLKTFLFLSTATSEKLEANHQLDNPSDWSHMGTTKLSKEDMENNLSQLEIYAKAVGIDFSTEINAERDRLGIPRPEDLQEENQYQLQRQ